MKNPAQAPPANDLLDAVRRAARQEQFLKIASPEEAAEKFRAHLDLKPAGVLELPLSQVLGRVLADNIAAPVDAPPFDRSVVDGFAVRAADTIGASEASPKKLILNAEVIGCGHAPALEVRSGTATAIATGGVMPRGADAVVMIEQTELDEAAAPAIEIKRAAITGQFVAFAGSDIARGETLLRKGTVLSSREIGMLAACGLAAVNVVRRPRVAVLSTGDELTEPGTALKPAQVYDSNGAIIAAAVAEAGGEAVSFGAFRDDEAELGPAIQRALAECDMVILSGGTSKGAGDLSHRIVSKLGSPGILVHGVALKPGKPLCLAAIGKKPLIVLPGFPTSAIFTFHAFAAPVIRAYAGLPAEAAKQIDAKVPVSVASELGRKEFVMVSLVEADDETIAFPSGKGSWSVTSFSQSDGFLEIDALAQTLEANSNARVTLLGSARAPDIVIMGSHDIALDIVIDALAEDGFVARSLAIGSLGGVNAAQRGECDIAPIHLVDEKTGIYNRHLVAPGMSLHAGWRRMQGVVFRAGDKRFESLKVDDAIAAVLNDSTALMVNRNAGAGTRILIDKLLEGARPAGYSNQPRSHNAVAAAVAQGRADWGVAIEPVAKLYGLGFLPLAPEHYDFLVVDSRKEKPAVKAFLAALKRPAVREKIAALGMDFGG
jgi:putative molybdopterin biosynthesis protein